MPPYLPYSLQRKRILLWNGMKHQSFRNVRNSMRLHLFCGTSRCQQRCHSLQLIDGHDQPVILRRRLKLKKWDVNSHIFEWRSSTPILQVETDHSNILWIMSHHGSPRLLLSEFTPFYVRHRSKSKEMRMLYHACRESMGVTE